MVQLELLVLPKTVPLPINNEQGIIDNAYNSDSIMVISGEVGSYTESGSAKRFEITQVSTAQKTSASVATLLWELKNKISQINRDRNAELKIWKKIRLLKEYNTDKELKEWVDKYSRYSSLSATGEQIKGVASAIDEEIKKLNNKAIADTKKNSRTKGTGNPNWDNANISGRKNICNG